MFYYLRDYSSSISRKDMRLLGVKKTIALKEELYLKTFAIDVTMCRIGEPQKNIVRGTFWATWHHFANESHRKMYGATADEYYDERVNCYARGAGNDNHLLNIGKTSSTFVGSQMDFYVVSLGSIIFQGTRKAATHVIWDE